MNPEKDYYAILGVSPDADHESIESAYEELSRELQPDLGQPASDPVRMQELDEAFDVLDDPARRADYDNARAIALSASDSRPGSGAVPARRRDLTLPIAIGLILSGIAVLAVGAFVLVNALTDDEESDGGGEFIQLPSGLQYRVDAEGDGPGAEMGNVVTVHYTGALASGEEFDSSAGRAPFSFLLGATQVLAGWDEGIAGMKRGEKRRLIIPPQLGYGEQGFQGVIPPNATLTFDVEVVAIDGPSPETPPEVEGEENELERGLKTIDIIDGDGAEAATGSTVVVHYTGWLEADGTRFDTSFADGSGASPAFSFQVGSGDVIDGWDLGLPGMKEGGTRRLIIPSALAYGPEGRQPTIPGDATLIFDIHLLDVQE
jgi:peptidylprolyl isomerase